MLILTMDVHQALGQRAQQPERYDSPVHTAGVSPIQVDLPRQNYLLLANVNTVLIQSGIDFLSDVAAQQEDALHSGLTSTGTYHANIGAPPTSRRPSASTMIDLPAPVSPVSTLKPDPNSMSSCSMVAKSVTLRSLSMAMSETTSL